MILVSACLCGQRCRYDGKSKENEPLVSRLGWDQIVPVCPEQLGGLPTPRLPCRLVGGNGEDVLADRARVIDTFDNDHTVAFIRGARLTLETALSRQVDRCCLKAKSPSCGSGCLARQWGEDSLPHGYRPVLGVTAALLMAHGICVEEIP
jgi:uncharacterized protein YbbK (DUF523 family)